MIQDELWPLGEELVARCHTDRTHAAPDAGCTCGIHAVREPTDVLSYLRGRDEPHTIGRVLGRVLLWGDVVEHERGWRASHAYPLKLLFGRPLPRLGEILCAAR